MSAVVRELDTTWQARPKMSKTPGAPVSKPCGGSHDHQLMELDQELMGGLIGFDSPLSFFSREGLVILESWMMIFRVEYLKEKGDFALYDFILRKSQNF